MELAKSKCSRLLCMVLLLALVIQAATESSGGGRSLFLHRKVFWERKVMDFQKLVPENRNGGGKRNNNDAESMPEDWELRRVPAGPDPLHHNGQDPKKPRTTP